jgi:hypothetical protein
MSAIEMQSLLQQLHAERVGTAVTEIASLRAELSGPQVG